MTTLDRALHEMHEQLWDDEAGMVRLYGLHLVRETALGAFLDLEAGKLERAQRALRNVLRYQYPPTVDPRWAGTFKTHAAQPDAGTVDGDGRARTQEWRDYDPNGRQFLGVILWVTERLFGHVLPDDLRKDMIRAVRSAAEGEPPSRIGARYSNVAMLHAWLSDASGGSATSSLGSQLRTQLGKDGDLAEYNSPTYDAISLLAACLLADFSANPALRNLGHEVIDRMCARLNVVWHPGLGVQAGPYTRAYGFDPRLYVSLMSVMMAAIDIPAAGPLRLDDTTTHVHDLYFLPLLRRLCGGLRNRISPQAVIAPRRHVQRFGEIVATSLVEPEMVVGWEHGRRSRFALDQYAPFTMISRDGFIGVRARADTLWVDVVEITSHVYELRCERRPDHDASTDLASLTVVASRAPVTHENELLFGDVTLQFPGIAVEVRLPRGQHA